MRRPGPIYFSSIAFQRQHFNNLVADVALFLAWGNHFCESTKKANGRIQLYLYSDAGEEKQQR